MASTDIKTIFQNLAMGLLVAAGLFFSILLLSYSWMKILVVSLILVCIVIWLVSHGKLKKALKYLVLSLMIFGICFTSFERYIFWNAGYPSTYTSSNPNITIFYPGILKVSLTEIVQSAKATNAFNLFRLQHFGEITFESIALSTTFPGGRIEITFYNEGTNMGFGFISSSGYSYHASTIPWIGQPPSRMYSQLQTPEDTLKQMDGLGIQWFYNQAYEIYQNRTGTNLNTSSLDVSTQWQEYNEYRGMVLEMAGWQQRGNSIQDIFHVVFKPDGTLLYMNIQTD
jgi:hypothetical protein